MADQARALRTRRPAQPAATTAGGGPGTLAVAVLRLVFLAFVLVLWWAAARAAPPGLFASPLAVAEAGWRLIADGSLAPALLQSLAVYLAGTGAAVVAGIALGALMGMFRPVGYDFFATFGIALLAGRDFSPAAADDRRQFRFDATPTDASRAAVMIVDSVYARALGFAAPEEALSRLVYAGGDVPFEIVGVVAHRPLSLTGNGYAATAYVLNTALPLHVVRIAGPQIEDGIAAIDALLRARAPAAPISRRFVDDYFREQYEPYARVSQVFTLLSGAALAIALLGLVAMALQVTHRRRREVGVRKVLGATSNGIACLLIGGLAQPVLVGGLLAWPAAQLATTRYLNAFVDPIEQSPLIYLGALSFALVVAILAVAAETLRAARKRPADILRA